MSNTHLTPPAPGHPTDNKPLLVGGAVAAVAIAAVAASANQGGAQEATAGAPAAAAPAAPAAGELWFGDLRGWPRAALPAAACAAACAAALVASATASAAASASEHSLRQPLSETSCAKTMSSLLFVRALTAPIFPSALPCSLGRQQRRAGQRG